MNLIIQKIQTSVHGLVEFTDTPPPDPVVMGVFTVPVPACPDQVIFAVIFPAPTKVVSLEGKFCKFETHYPQEALTCWFTSWRTQLTTCQSSLGILLISTKAPLMTVVMANSLKFMGMLELTEKPSVLLTRVKYQTARPLAPQRLFHH